jgi:hypothetical protein
MNPNARPLESALRPCRQAHVGAAATLWPVWQQPDAVRRTGRCLPDTRRHPQRTRAALVAHVVDRYSKPGQVVIDPVVGRGTAMVEAAYTGRHKGSVGRRLPWQRRPAGMI